MWNNLRASLVSIWGLFPFKELFLIVFHFWDGFPFLELIPPPLPAGTSRAQRRARAGRTHTHPHTRTRCPAWSLSLCAWTEVFMLFFFNLHVFSAHFCLWMWPLSSVRALGEVYLKSSGTFWVIVYFSCSLPACACVRVWTRAASTRSCISTRQINGDGFVYFGTRGLNISDTSWF